MFFLSCFKAANTIFKQLQPFSVVCWFHAESFFSVKKVLLQMSAGSSFCLLLHCLNFQLYLTKLFLKHPEFKVETMGFCWCLWFGCQRTKPNIGKSQKNKTIQSIHLQLLSLFLFQHQTWVFFRHLWTGTLSLLRTELSRTVSSEKAWWTSEGLQIKLHMSSRVAALWLAANIMWDTALAGRREAM